MEHKLFYIGYLLLAVKKVHYLAFFLDFARIN